MPPKSISEPTVIAIAGSTVNVKCPVAVAVQFPPDHGSMVAADANDAVKIKTARIASNFLIVNSFKKN